MLGLYFTVSFILIGLTFLSGNKKVWVALIVVFLGLQASLPVYGYMNYETTELKYFEYDALGIIFLGVLSLLSIFTVYHSFLYLGHRNEDPRKQRIYLASLISLVVSMTGVYLAQHLGVMWFFVEATTLSVSALIYHERTSLALEATWKYVFICSVGIALAFVGIIFLGTSLDAPGSGDLGFDSIPDNITGAQTSLLKLAFIFMMVGFSTKMGLFPLHPIAVDAHTVAPPPISAFISTTLMNVGFVAIFRIYTLFAHTSIHEWMNTILLISGLLSIFVSAVFLLRTKHLKRMSAYSSLEHMGLAALGLAAGGIGYFAAIFHLVLHSFAKASLFYQVDQIHRTYSSYLIRDTGRYFYRNLPGAVVMILVFVAITAMPPSGMFITEFRIMQALFSSTHYTVIILALLFLTVALFGLGKNFLALLFQKPETDQLPGPGRIPLTESLSQFFLLGLVFYLGFNPPAGLLEIINDAIKSLP